jgi:FkbM family methyltransferase
MRLYEGLLRLRPAQLAELAKRLCRIDRTEVITVNGDKFWIDPVSILGLSILKQGEFEIPLTRAVIALLGSGDSFVDVGANEGYFSILAARKVGLRGRVLAIEPQSRLRDVLDRNIAANLLTNVEVALLAVADRQGEALLYLRPSTNTGASSFIRHWRFGSRANKVATTTLDQLLFERRFTPVRLMKIDCEGAEPLVVAGAKKTLQGNQVEILIMDYHPQICGIERCRETHRRLIDSGYDVSVRNGLLFYFIDSARNDISRLGGPALPEWLE